MVLSLTHFVNLSISRFFGLSSVFQIKKKKKKGLQEDASFKV